MIKVTVETADALANQFSVVASQYNKTRSSLLRDLMKDTVNAFKKKHPERWANAIQEAFDILDHHDAVTYSEELL